MTYKDTTIKSVKEYLDWINRVSTSNVSSDCGETIDFEHHNMYYRGQSCKCWNLSPGIFRKPYSVGIVEHHLLKKASLQLWKELSSYTTYLEKLVYLQHYEMKTRLLDVTFNPLIALFFACKQHDCAEGGVVYCGYQQSAENERMAELTSEFVFNYSFENFEDETKDFFEKKEITSSKFFCPLFVLPPINNPRIEYQNGAFIMAPLLKKGKDRIYLNNDTLDDSGLFSEQRALIPDSCKSSIVKELHILGIHEGIIFQGITQKIGTILIEEKWELEKVKF